MMGREEFVKYPYDDDLYEMIPTSFSQTSLRDQDIMWTTPTPQVTQSADEAPDSNYLSRLWNEDFSHRPSWCDAKLALEQIRRGRASGNKPALYFRSFLQTVLFNMGRFIQAHSPIVIMIGMIVLFIFAVGLKDATIETDIDKLWVQKHGRLHDEREYVKSAFKSEILRNEEWEKLNLKSMANKNGSGFSTINEDLANKAGQEQFLMLIQTAKKRGGTIGKEEFLLHEKTMSEISQLSIELFNQTWKLTDICFKPAAPDIPDDLKVLFDKLLKGLLPCVMITPLDCFWDGAKPNGPDPPIPLNHLAGMLDALPGPTISWKNFDPAAALNEAYDLLGIPTLETVITLFKRAGINDAYQGRPCLEPLDPECPKKSPNHVDICTIVDDFLKYNAQHNDLYGFGVGNGDSISSMLKTHTNESESLNSTALSTDEPFVPFDSPQGKKEKCEKYADRIRQILLSDKNLYDSFLPAWSKIDFAKKLSGSCKGFAENFMRWPQDLIIGGIKRDHDKIFSFEAIESVYMLASPHDIYARIDAEKLQDLDRPWTLETANDVLDTWQRHFADYVYRHKNNSDDSRILHPLAGTSVNDMLKEFSKFNPTVIIIGYVFMPQRAKNSAAHTLFSGFRKLRPESHLQPEKNFAGGNPQSHCGLVRFTGPQ
uniref:Uncharacterized protein n=1 Tax=Romanomermis culicivorax TaxID=13658 RepID=A0A915ISB9_ROMCU